MESPREQTSRHENCGHGDGAPQPELLMGPVAKLRVPQYPRRGTVSGYFNNLDMMLKATAAMSGKAAGVYLTLNPVVPDLLNRAANRLVNFAKTTTHDNEIQRRCWFFVDCDARRLTGISATDQEHAAALTARQCGE
jgi:hypothetical protein